LRCFSALQRAEIAEIHTLTCSVCIYRKVSVLFNEPKLLKSEVDAKTRLIDSTVSVLFNEPKLLK